MTKESSKGYLLIIGSVGFKKLRIRSVIINPINCHFIPVFEPTQLTNGTLKRHEMWVPCN